jgi:hypothetical protein
LVSLSLLSYMSTFFILTNYILLFLGRRLKEWKFLVLLFSSHSLTTSNITINCVWSPHNTELILLVEQKLLVFRDIVILVIMYVETFKADVIVFIGIRRHNVTSQYWSILFFGNRASARRIRALSNIVFLFVIFSIAYCFVYPSLIMFASKYR